MKQMHTGMSYARGKENYPFLESVLPLPFVLFACVASVNQATYC